MSGLVVEEEQFVIGIYGLPGSGKSQILRELQEHPRFGGKYLYFEGSEVIGGLVEGGLKAFKKLQAHEKEKIRRQAIKWIRDECVRKQKTGIVAGHFSFWSRGDDEITEVWTPEDGEVFSHIMYLQVPGYQLLQQITSDQTRSDREAWGADRLESWQVEELKRLRQYCQSSKIDISTVVGGEKKTIAEVMIQLTQIRPSKERQNIHSVNEALKAWYDFLPAKPDAVLLIDGDKTLAPQDTGGLFWEAAGSHENLVESHFKESGYSFRAFQEAARIYYRHHKEFGNDDACDKTAKQVAIYPDFKDLLAKLAGSESVEALVVTCGLRTVWEKVLQEAELSHVHVLGAGNELDYFVTPEIKAGIAKTFRQNDVYVWAFGDSPLDLPMLQQADQAVVVVGDEESRSKSMEDQLREAIDEKGLQARQVRPSQNGPGRLDEGRLPTVNIEDLEISHILTGKFDHISATHKKAAKLLMTPMRDAAIQGPALREVHRTVGRYLATEYLSELIGLQQYHMDHVQSGKTADGYRLFHEKKTIIIPLMRGGEPMAFGVSDIFPLAPFVHAKNPEDIRKRHLRGMTNVILVDAVVNSGDSIAEFVKRVRELRPTVRILAVSGVTQEGAVRELPGKLEGCGGVTLVSLRTSKNKFTGKGGTDTGARLFNTTEME